MDMEKVIKGVHDARRYLEDREWVDKSVGVHIDALNDALAMLKEDCHNCKLECLLQKYDQLKEKHDKLLQEQEAKQGKWERQYSRPGVYANLFWWCSVCGEPTRYNDAGIFYQYCPHCGAKLEACKET